MYNNCFHLTTKVLKLFVCVIFSKTFSKSVFKCFHLEFPCEEAEEVEVEGVI